MPPRSSCPLPWIAWRARSFTGAAALGLIAVVSVLAPACAQGNGHVDPCKRALDRLVEECGFELDGVEDLDVHCEGASACVGVCLEQSPCEDIGQEEGEFADCAAQCQQQNGS